MRHPARTLCALALAACSTMTSMAVHAQASTPPAGMEHVAWSKNANIYEVNIRQFSPEGSFKAFSAQLPRLKKMGVDILWIMPINPIGEKNRKGPLGSYYAVQNYTAVNPEFGTMDDFKVMVNKAHALGMHVIIDWVPNHTAFDHPWVTEHPDWYLKNEKGEIYPVTMGKEAWTDVTGLDYSNKALWKGMTDAMAFWLREADIDGFRCDVANNVPTAFWNHARAELDSIKPIFMLAEGDKPDQHEHAFDMTYGWDSWDLFVKIAKGEADARTLAQFLADPPMRFPRDAYRMRFTSNHDKNSWDGSDKELYGPAFKAMSVLSMTLPGMPLIYDGQESGLDKRLEFFKKDPVAWKNYRYAPFYAQLLKLKHEHPALWNGQYGADAEVIGTGNDKVFAFRRKKDSDAVTVVVNLSGAKQAFTLPGKKRQQLGAWDYRIDARK